MEADGGDAEGDGHSEDDDGGQTPLSLTFFSQKFLFLKEDKVI